METQESASHGVSRNVVIGLVLPGIAGYAALFAYAMQHTSYDIWGALWLAPILAAVTLPLLSRFAKNDADPRIFRILALALILKFAATLPRYYMVAVTYERGDSFRYADTAVLLRRGFLTGDFDLSPLGENSITGTQFVEIVTGLVYTAIGPTFLGGYIFFSWLCFIGLFFFYRAFCVAIPDGDSIRYALLLFFLPSMLFWPSSIGKEALMTLALGLTAYGCALMLTRRFGASLYLLPGLAGILMIRPHVAMFVIAGLSLGYILRGFGGQRKVALGSFRTIFGLAVIAAATLLVIRQVSQFFGLDEFNLDTATQTLESASEQTGQGGSEFDTSPGPSLADLPMDLVTVLFRPFPFEVHNVQALLAALEGSILMLLFILSWPRLRTIAKRLATQPYITFCITYIVLFCFIFSSFQNFGILARERVMVYPFVIALLALPMLEIRNTVRRRAILHARAADDAAEQSNEMKPSSDSR